MFGYENMIDRQYLLIGFDRRNGTVCKGVLTVGKKEGQQKWLK